MVRAAARSMASRLSLFDILANSSSEGAKSISVSDVILRSTPERSNVESSDAGAAWLGGAGKSECISISSSAYSRSFPSSWPGGSEGCLAGGVSGLKKSSPSSSPSCDLDG